MPTYTAFCQEANGRGTIWIEAIEVAEVGDPEEQIELARSEAIKACAYAWYGDDDEIEPDIVCLGLAKGDIEIVEWDDSHLE